MPNIKLTENDVNPSHVNELEASVESTEKKNFDEKIKANLTNLINKYFTALDNSVKADITTELVKSIEKETSQKIQLEYRTYDLTQDFMDRELKGCLSSVAKGHKIVTGISVLTVKGTWTTNTLKKTFANFEANAKAFNTLTVESKNQYDKDKQTILNGNFEAISIIFAVAYRIKK